MQSGFGYVSGFVGSLGAVGLLGWWWQLLPCHRDASMHCGRQVSVLFFVLGRGVGTITMEFLAHVATRYVSTCTEKNNCCTRLFKNGAS